MKISFLFCTMIYFALLIQSPIVSQPYNFRPNLNLDPTIEAKIDALILQMTLKEKAELLSGTDFDSKPVERLGIPALRMTDGPVGVRYFQSTAFPASVAMAATWDPDLIEQVGHVLGREAKAKGKNVLLGPCINIHRVPHGGRNFESFGEDPFLAGQIAAAYIQGVQREKVIATAKHFAVNNQEFERMSIDVRIDERSLHEIYLPAFKAAIEQGGAWAVMSAYNRLNGHYCSGNTYLLTDILKGRWGFKGFVMSDWGAVHSTIPDLFAGTDIEMPLGRYFEPQQVIAAVHEGFIRPSQLDDKVRRMLRAMFAMGFFDQKQNDLGAVDTPAHRQLARTVAQQGIVLLKNQNNLLPLDRKKIKSIAIIGPNAEVAVTGGGGSSFVNPFYAVSPLEGIRAKVGNKVAVRYARGIPIKSSLIPISSECLRPPVGVDGLHGLLAEYFNNMSFSDEPVIRRIDPQINFNVGDGKVDERLNADKISIRWTGRLVPKESGLYAIGLSSDDGTRLYLDGQLRVDNWGDHGIITKTDTLQLEAGREYDLRVEFYENGGGAAAILGWEKIDVAEFARRTTAERQKVLSLAQNSDVVVICVGNTPEIETEGKDRDNLNLPEGQAELISAVCQVNPRTIVVLNSGAAVLMNEWIDQVPALLEAWFPGQEGGNALADVLFGDVNPSGKLPTTFPKRWEDAAAYGNYPGRDGTVHYAEGIFVGYRHFDKNDIEPLFPFGYGLSYTTFSYRDLTVEPASLRTNGKISVGLTVQNTGSRAGAEVVQLYVKDLECSVPRPLKELKGFKKVFLQPREQQRIVFELDPSALAFYDIVTKDWVTEPGIFEVMIGSSSRNIQLVGQFELQD